MKLEDIAIYLPYGVHLLNKYGSWSNKTTNKSLSLDKMLNHKLLLRPIENIKEDFVDSDGHTENLYKTLDLEKYANIDYFENPLHWVDHLPYSIVRELLFHHFDISGMIKKGFAVNLTNYRK